MSISFDGIEQLTDAFLFSLHHCKLSLQSLRLVSLAGISCSNIKVYGTSALFLHQFRKDMGGGAFLL